MKFRKILPLLLALLLLVGCGVRPGGGAGTEPTQTDPPAETTLPPETEPHSLMDDRQALDEDGILWYIPNETVADYAGGTLLGYGQDLLVYALDSEDGCGTFRLARIDGETGSLVAEEAWQVAGYTTARVWDDTIVLCDSIGGTVRFLDGMLRTQVAYTHAPGGAWYAGADLETLYVVSHDTGVAAHNLRTGESRSLMEASRDVSAMGDWGDGAALRYTGDSGGKCYAVLDLTTGEIADFPVVGDFDSVSRSGDLWMATGYQNGQFVRVFQGQEAWILPTGAGQPTLLAREGRVLCATAEGLSLYTPQGDFLSGCVLPENAAGFLGSNPVWDGRRNGYFLLQTQETGQGMLLFWDLSAGAQGADLNPVTAWEYDQPTGGETADPALYQRAGTLAEEYGVRIRIADQCDTAWTSFSAVQVSDYDTVSAGLDLLEAALEMYPEGFFRQLGYGSVQGVEFQLVGCLQAQDAAYGTTSYAAFTLEDTDRIRIVADVYSANVYSYFHELSHVIDKKLAWDSVMRPDALFSEEGWAALQPEGFAYTCDYANVPEGTCDGYFVDGYSQTYPTEDRARILERAMEPDGGFHYIYQNADHLLSKLSYYCDCIRDCFDTTGWPEITAWEQPLRENGLR